MKIIEDTNIPRASIFSDSKSALSALANHPRGNNSSYLIYQIKDKIRDLSNTGRKIKLIWIPNHCGIIGNELADTRAKSASHCGRNCLQGIPLGDVKNFFKDELYIKFFEWCEITAKERGKIYFENYFIRNRDTWFKKVDLSRREIVFLCRLRCGHTSLKESLARFNTVPSPLCPVCEISESANHIFWQCNRYNEQRNYLIKNLTLVRGFLPHPIESLLVNINDTTASILGSFISKINIDI